MWPNATSKCHGGSIRLKHDLKLHLRDLCHQCSFLVIGGCTHLSRKRIRIKLPAMPILQLDKRILLERAGPLNQAIRCRPQNSLANHPYHPKTIRNKPDHAMLDKNTLQLRTPNSSTRRPHLAALSTPTPHLLIVLIRSNLSRPLRRLVHRRRRITSLISWRRRRESAVLHAVAIGVLRLAVVWVLLVVVRGRAVRVVVARAAGAASQHPGVVSEGWQVFARAAPCVPVAADEVGEEEEEEDCDYGVADGGAGLWRMVSVRWGEAVWRFALGYTYVAPPP
jgi:hypothetical protein